MCKLKLYLLAFVVFSLNTSCFEDQDDNLLPTSQLNDFVWKGMNSIYLYKDNIPELANDRFATPDDYLSYLNGFSAPEELFESLIYQRQNTDRFSVIVNDYIALEQQLGGTSLDNGMSFGLFRFSANDNQVFGYVRYVLPESDASAKGIVRGDIIYAVNNTTLTSENYRSLLGSNSYTITLGTYSDNGTPDDTSDDFVVSSAQNITLNKTQYTANPIYNHSIINQNGNNVGYLMYNAFTGSNTFDSQLNSVFGEFKTAGITELVLDLRYNGGGAVNTATWLASMITGQFNGETFFSEQYNSEIQEQFLTQDPEFLNNPFVDQMIRKNSNGEITFQQNINHLNLSRVYVLTTGSTASASELVINGLRPYVDVVQIGRTTVGKYQASVTIYDSPNFGRANANTAHSYAMQPLIYKALNAAGYTDFDTGLVPDIVLSENFSNLGVIGDPNETYLAAALAHISGVGRLTYPETSLDELNVNTSFKTFKNEMYTDKMLPYFSPTTFN